MSALALLALGATAATAQYSTPVGSGAAKPKTLRATAVLEFTGSLEKPSASRLMPIAVWDGEHYQPAGLYLARPDPLALETGTQYELERSGEPVGLFNVRAAGQLHGEWIGVGKFQAEPAPPPPPKLKASKHLPVLSNGKPVASDAAKDKSPGGESDRPTLHRKADDNSPSSAGSSTSSGSGASASSPSSSSSSSGSPDKPADTSTSKPAGTSSPSSSPDSDHPTLHRRTDSTDASTASGTSTSTAGGASGTAAPSTPGTPSSTGASTSDPDGPTLHRRDSTDASAKAPDVDPDRPTLHKHDDSARASDDDPDRPTLHRARIGGDQTASIDPDRPHLRYGPSGQAEQAALPARLEGAPATMQQVVAVSDSATGEVRTYQYHWPSSGDATQMQASLATLAAQAIAKANSATVKPVAQFGPATHTAAARKARQAKTSGPALGPPLVDEHFTAYELSFSGGATLVYSAHTADEGPKRIYVTLIAQPDFSGKPQVLLQQVARGDRLDEVPAMQLVDALDTDNDQRAELIFQLNGAAQPAAPPEPSQAAKDFAASTATDEATQFARDAAASAQASASAAHASSVEVPEREFAIYRVSNGKAVQVFNTGPLP